MFDIFIIFIQWCLYIFMSLFIMMMLFIFLTSEYYRQFIKRQLSNNRFNDFINN